MRKQRSWNPEHECFFYFYNGKYYNSEDMSKCISERPCFEFNWGNAEDSIGLTDNNGKEIFKGDIVSDGNRQNNNCISGTHIVEYLDGGFYPFSISGWEGVMDVSRCEIIGNIHENKELL